MLIVRPPRFITSMMPRMTWGFFGELNKIFLTFDDGPTPDVTTRVLEELKKYNAKATFFCLGRNVDHYPDIFKDILENGHSVGNHSYSHLKGFGTKNHQYFSDIELANRLIGSELFRPPYGRILRNQVTEILRNYAIIMWDVLSFDYNRHVKGETIVKNVIKYTRSGSIIVFHDSAKARKNVYFALPRVLEYFNEKGFDMLAIPMKKEEVNKLRRNRTNNGTSG